MAIRQVINSVIKPAIRKVIDAIMNAISAYRFDGFDDYAVLAYRAINPDGDIDIEWEQYGVPTSPNLMIVCQCDNSNITSREFMLRYINNRLEMQVGGSVIIGTGTNIMSDAGKWRILLTGSDCYVFFNDAQVFYVGGRVRGTAREPAAPTRIGVRNSGGSLVEFFNGVLRNIKINGTIYPIADRNQSIQLPSPSNLGAELVTQTVLENPALKGTQWTYLGNGRWQYIGDGTLNVLRFIDLNNAPEQGYLEFEIESISGQITCTEDVLAGSLFTSAGKYRYFYTQKLNNSNTFGRCITFKRAPAGTVASCIIKNISFKPLIVNGPELFTGTTQAVQDGWAYSNGVLTATNVPAYQPSTSFSILPLVAGKQYLVEYTVNSITGGVRVQLVGGAAQNLTASTTAGKATFVVYALAGNTWLGFQAITANTSANISNISIKEITALCNPLTLVNANNYWWSTVGAASRDVYVFDGVDDHGAFTYPIGIAENQDFEMEFTLFSNVDTTFNGILSQNTSNTTNNFLRCLPNTQPANLQLIFNDSSSVNLFPRTGSQAVVLRDGLKRKVKITRVGGVVTPFLDGVAYPSTSGRNGSLNIGLFGRVGTSYFNGSLYDLKINGVSYTVNDRNQTIQLPEPLGLGAETFDINANNLLTGSVTREGDAFVFNVTAGEGTLIRQPVDALIAGRDYLVELEIFDYVVGGLANNTNGFVNFPITGNGTYRNVFNTGSASRITLSRSSQTCNFKVRNISVKPLAVANATELVPNGDFSAGTTSWTALGSATFTVTSGQASVGYVAGQNSRVEQFVTLEADRYYQITADVVSISGVTAARLLLLRGAAGSYTTIGQVDASAAGKINFVVLAPATDAIISMRTSDGLNNGTIVWDNVSIRKLDSLCNPMQLINTTSDRWREIDK